MFFYVIIMENNNLFFNLPIELQRKWIKIQVATILRNFYTMVILRSFQQ
jgi:hypothetical protein